MKSGWVTKKLGEVCEAITSQLRQKDLKYDSGEFPIYGASGLITKVGFYQSENECVGVVKDGAGVGRVMNLPPCSSVIGTMLIIRPKQLITNQYLYHLLERLDLGAGFSGATIPHVYFRDFKDRDILLPPLSEQDRIVAKIDAALEKMDKLKANAEKNLANAKELFQSALDEAMRPKPGWVEKRLGEVCVGKLSYGTSSPSRDYDAHVRYIRITDIDDNGRLLNDFVSPKEYESKHVLEDGDLVFARTGATVGKSYLYSPSDGACVYAGYLIRARVDQSIIRPKYLFYFTKTSRYKLFIQQSQAAAAQPNVNAEKYSNMLVPIPPVHEQDEIVSCIGRAQGLSIQLQQNYARQIADCAEMRQAILREAFEGRL